MVEGDEKRSTQIQNILHRLDQTDRSWGTGNVHVCSGRHASRVYCIHQDWENSHVDCVVDYVNGDVQVIASECGRALESKYLYWAGKVAM